jgi:hypothetical protein
MEKVQDLLHSHTTPAGSNLDTAPAATSTLLIFVEVVRCAEAYADTHGEDLEHRADRANHIQHLPTEDCTPNCDRPLHHMILFGRCIHVLSRIAIIMHAKFCEYR